jgi:hypothetical protein
MRTVQVPESLRQVPLGLKAPQWLERSPAREGKPLISSRLIPGNSSTCPQANDRVAVSEG